MQAGFLRQGGLEQLTHDHRVSVGSDKTYLSRAMGIDTHLDIDFRALPVEPGDAYLLTTDGVHDFVDDNLSAQLLYVAALPDSDENEFYRKLTELPFPPPLEPGMILDGYRILREIHASTRTQLYLALDTETDSRVIMKTPSVNYDDDPEYIDQFLHEEWAGRRINSAHTVSVLEPHDRRQCLYYITEYIEGQTLRQWMHDHPQPALKEVRTIAEQIARGLVCAGDLFHADHAGSPGPGIKKGVPLTRHP